MSSRSRKQRLFEVVPVWAVTVLGEVRGLSCRAG
jgi:hypothetical protein